MELKKSCINCHYYDLASMRCWRHDINVNKPEMACSDYCGDDKEVEELRKKLIEAYNDCDDLKSKNNAFEKRIDALLETIDTLEKENVKLECGNLAHKAYIEDRKSAFGEKIREKESKIADLMQQVADKDNQIWHLECKWKATFQPRDCHAYASRMKAKYDSLIKVGFTEDQAMQFLPMWIDEEV